MKCQHLLWNLLDLSINFTTGEEHAPVRDDSYRGVPQILSLWAPRFFRCEPQILSLCPDATACHQKHL